MYSGVFEKRPNQSWSFFLNNVLVFVSRKVLVQKCGRAVRFNKCGFACLCGCVISKNIDYGVVAVLGSKVDSKRSNIEVEHVTNLGNRY